MSDQGPIPPANDIANEFLNSIEKAIRVRLVNDLDRHIREIVAVEFASFRAELARAVAGRVVRDEKDEKFEPGLRARIAERVGGTSLRSTAAELGMSHSWLSVYLRDANDPSLRDLYRFASIIGLDDDTATRAITVDGERMRQKAKGTP